MSFFRFKTKLFPLVAAAAVFYLIAVGLILARDENIVWFMLGAAVWLCLFGCWRGVLRVLPAYVAVGGIFTLIAYFAYGNDGGAAVAMAVRFAAVFLAVAVGLGIESVRMTRCLSQMHMPRSVTLGMLIATSFVPVLKGEVTRVREAMRTRGAGSMLNPKIFYRAFLVPFVTRLVNISDTLSLSVETRGFVLGKARYTVYKKESFALSDALFILGLAVGLVLTVTL